MRLLTLVITIAALVAAIPMNIFASTVVIGGDATANFTNAQFYTLSNSNVTTYTTSSGTTVAGSIYPSDLCKVLSPVGTYWQVSYPISGGTKTAYVNKANILSSTSYCKSITINENTTVYRKSDMSTSFGTVYTTDTIYMLCPISNGKAQIMYNVTGGWKIGWIYASTNSTTTTLSRALYNNSTLSSKITCGFDGYVSTPGRHEGIDFAYGSGINVYSLITGTVTNIVEGSSSSLSTIAIYDENAQKTVVYMHLDPSSNIAEGDTVYPTTIIGYESSRGANGAIHTHVEVCDGYRTLGYPSVNDYTLTNSNPTSYWNSKGYTVQ